MSERRIRSAQWLPIIDSTADTLREYLTKQREAEAAERGHECGHVFTIHTTTRGHYSVTGDPEHYDAPEGDGDDMPWTLKVRAHSLRDALLLAALTPLGEWSGPGLDEDDDEASR